MIIYFVCIRLWMGSVSSLGIMLGGLSSLMSFGRGSWNWQWIMGLYTIRRCGALRVPGIKLRYEGLEQSVPGEGF